MKNLLLFLILIIPRYQSAQTTEEFLQEGKEWKYTMIWLNGLDFPEVHPELSREYTRIFRIEGSKEIDGKEYKILNVLDKEEEFEPHALRFAYLREDVEEGKIWLYTEGPNDCGYFGHFLFARPYMEYLGMGGKMEFLIYDFKNPDSSGAIEGYERAGEMEMSFAYGDEIVPCYSIAQDMYLVISSKLGVIECNAEIASGGCDIFGKMNAMEIWMVNPQHYPFLYEVCDGEGNILFTNSRFYPGCIDPSNGNIDTSRDITVQYLNGKIKIDVHRPSEVNIYNSIGQMVYNNEIIDNVDIDVETFTKGIYVISVDGKAYKIVIR